MFKISSSAARIYLKLKPSPPKEASENIQTPELATKDNHFSGRTKQLGLRVKPEFAAEEVGHNYPYCDMLGTADPLAYLDALCGDLEISYKFAQELSGKEYNGELLDIILVSFVCEIEAGKQEAIISGFCDRDLKIYIMRSCSNPRLSISHLPEILKKENKTLFKEKFQAWEGDSHGNYMMVLQYADKGDLREYSINNPNLNWDDKSRIAGEIALGLAFLHNNQIIHRNLSSSSSSNIDGMPSFIDPQCFKNPTYNRMQIAIKIYNGEREKPVEGTPSKYVDLYKWCGLRLLQNNTEYDYQNIIKFYELTKEPSNEYYIMILEYPDEGKLCDYFSELQWTKKYPWL
ncbi:hypothetical protein C2G38_2207581 [Gigaspora rosea]|uniref:Serine-threonine/tyrosine-protein kinase catalytic domain-containing protein n=1 Tax=Gigaspora rosea TaxID=44941 RepID=A0A397UKZ2_9GLOM|nr:hypothetical protein C2G38_2207581 [Gigaspora rosea]